MSKRGGWKRGSTEIQVTSFPDRKQVSLCLVVEGNAFLPLAWFKSEEAADQFWDAMCKLTYTEERQ